MPQLVGPEGPLNARIAIIGEAPGKDEILQRRPFVGRAGRLLDSLLNMAGILRTECYITNVVKERPPNNDITPFINLGPKVPKVSPEFLTYRAQLLDELAIVNPNVYVPVGNTPLFALTGQKGIMKWRGSVLTATDGTKTIPTIHPAACLHFGQGRNDSGSDLSGGGSKGQSGHILQYFILADLARIKAESESPALPPIDYGLRTEPSFDQVMSFLTLCNHSGKMVAFDIETANGELSCISFAPNARVSMSIPFVCKGSQSYFSPEREAIVLRTIGALLRDPNVIKVGQNLMYDMTFLYHKYGIVTYNFHDTMIAQAILCPDLPRGLDFLTSIYTEVPYYKDERKERMRSDKTPDQQFWEYNAKDSLVCQMILPQLLTELNEQGNLDTYNRRIRLAHPLMYLQEHGIRMDIPGITKAAEDAEVGIADLTGQLQTIAGYELNPNSPSQLADYFYKVKKLKPYKSRKTGNATTDHDALTRIARKGHQEAQLVLDIRSLAKLKGTYYDVKLDDGRLKASFNPSGAADTGRLSSSMTIFGTGTNLQNQPPAMKALMLADPGYLLYEVDYGQAENRVVAYVAPEQRMIEAFESGADIHRRTASLIFNVPESEVTDDLRQVGKKTNHGLNYGQTFKGFALTNGIPESDAKWLVERYHNIYPDIRNRYHKGIQAQLAKDRTLTTPLGRKRKFLEAWGPELFKEAYAFIPQSTIGELINDRALVPIYHDRETYERVELLNQIHDSVLFQIPLTLPIGHHAVVLSDLKRSMETPLIAHDREFSIPTEFSVGKSAGNMKKVLVSTNPCTTYLGLAGIIESEGWRDPKAT